MFFTRTGSAGVGVSFDVLIIDEAQHSPLTILEALLPATDASPNKQVLFTGTVPKEEQDGEYIEGLRDRGRKGGLERTGWIEHTPIGADDPDLADKIDFSDPRCGAKRNGPSASAWRGRRFRATGTGWGTGAMRITGVKTSGNIGSFIRAGANASAADGYDMSYAHLRLVAGACSDAFAAQIFTDLALAAASSGVAQWKSDRLTAGLVGFDP